MKERRKKGRMGKASTGSLLLLLRGWEKGRKRGRVEEEEVERRAGLGAACCGGWRWTAGCSLLERREEIAGCWGCCGWSRVADQQPATAYALKFRERERVVEVRREKNAAAEEGGEAP